MSDQIEGMSDSETGIKVGFSIRFRKKNLYSSLFALKFETGRHFCFEFQKMEKDEENIHFKYFPDAIESYNPSFLLRRTPHIQFLKTNRCQTLKNQT